MPMKYMLDIPEAVSIVGWLHGLLFMGYLYLSWMVYDRRIIRLADFGLCFVAALIPFGPFFEHGNRINAVNKTSNGTQGAFFHMSGKRNGGHSQ